MGGSCRPGISIEDPQFVSFGSEGVEMENHLAVGGGNVVDIFTVGSRIRLGKIDVHQLGMLGFQGIVVAHIGLGQVRPALVIPNDLTVMEVGIAVLVRVVIVMAVKVPASVMDSRPASGTDVDSIF